MTVKRCKLAPRLYRPCSGSDRAADREPRRNLPAAHHSGRTLDQRHGLSAWLRSFDRRGSIAAAQGMAQQQPFPIAISQQLTTRAGPDGRDPPPGASFDQKKDCFCRRTAPPNTQNRKNGGQRTGPHPAQVRPFAFPITRTPAARLQPVAARPRARPGVSTGSAETTGSCSGAASTAGLGVGSGVGSALGAV